MPKVEYLGRKVSHNGLETNPKDLSALSDLPFQRITQSHAVIFGDRFIEDYAIYASILYELREIDFAAMMKETTQAQIQQVLEAENVDPGSHEGQIIDYQKVLDLEA
ncbi:reverse transcriptase [Phytophthora megakarya]|uniref:Reverse transcriptase n=1 Tax=Phytophthora megakarya TaxID=4795 RepID=A0A225WQS2_9STRA|nr:reverse transcriptase [Phytophthora megakarya]